MSVRLKRVDVKCRETSRSPVRPLYDMTVTSLIAFSKAVVEGRTLRVAGASPSMERLTGTVMSSAARGAESFAQPCDSARAARTAANTGILFRIIVSSVYKSYRDTSVSVSRYCLSP